MADLTKDQILEAIEKMSVLEISELVKAMEEKFGVSAAPVAVAGAAAPAAGGDAGGAGAVEKDEFDIVLVSAGQKKIAVIKEVRAITGLGLKEAKAVCDEGGKTIKEGASKQEADEIKEKLEAAGATIELK